MTIRYILDLTKEEYRDDFVALDEPTESNDKEFWQYEARDKLVEKLSFFLNDAKKYKQARSKNKSKTWLSHNAILVTGQRGTGKTVFLRNCKAMWDVYCKQALKSQSEIYFLESIDPTMLSDQDNFANVIIAQIYSEVESKLNSGNNCNANEGLKSDFYKKLKKLADALGKKEEFEGCSGIDKVLQYKSGINVERYFHDFVESAIQILDAEAFALPIDDVDMALDRAYEVVDEVRRLLGCPYIIPIVSGDYSLYEQMVNIHFDEKAYLAKTKNQEQHLKGVSLSNDLTNAYLTKVFPNQMRITLLPVEYIAPMITIKTSEDEGLFTYREYVASLQSQFYPLCSNENILNSWPKPESARELIQFCRMILPHDLDLAKENKNVCYKLWKNFINWAEQKQNGQAYVNVDSYLTARNRDIEDLFDISTLLSFNPKSQIKKAHLNWANKSFLSSQLHSLGIENKSKLLEITERVTVSSRPWKKRQDGMSWYLDNISLMAFGFKDSDRTLASLPPLEFFHFDSMVTIAETKKAYESFELLESEELKDEKSSVAPCHLNGLLLEIYTYGDLYSTMGNSYQYVFMSRAFELLLYSFSIKGDEDPTESLIGILARRPFYCIFNIAPTKAITSGEDENIDDFEKPISDSRVSYALVLSTQIRNWRKQHSGLFEKMQSEDFVTIFSFIFNKAFTAFHSFKLENYIGSNTVDNEYLTDHIRRFELIVINAAYTAMVPGEAIEANVAITKNQENIRSENLFRRSDRTLKRNISRFKASYKEEQVQNQFIRALESHPLFEIIKSKVNGGNVVKPRIKLGKTSPERRSNIDKKNIFISRDVINSSKVTRISARLPEHLTRKAKDYLEMNSEYYDTVKATKKELVPAIENDLMAYDYFESDFNDKSINFDDLNIISGNKAHNFIKVLYDINKSGKS